jgi:3',5'-cyclic AMP phosphodiesterase CpdA
MRTIAHISDLHFGTEDPAVTKALLGELEVSLVAISGDLTQRAKPEQFRAARAFLDALPVPFLVVPGNHDVPLYDIVSRFTHPLSRYREYISDNLMPSYLDQEMSLVGVNTAYGFTLKGGRITKEQAEAVRDKLANASVTHTSPAPWKAVIAHHPFILPKGNSDDERADGADVALPILREAGVDMILSGHLHTAYASDVAGFKSQDRSIIAVHAGTCISTRLRNEANGYNRLIIDGTSLTVIHRIWDGQQFIDGASKIYQRPSLIA